MSAASVISPVTGQPGTKVFDRIRSKDIIDSYKRSWNYDVSDYFREMDTIEVLECLETGYRFYYPHSTAGESKFYDEIYKHHAQNKDWYRKWGYDYQFAFDRIDAHSKVLDIGCGTGEFFKKIREKTDFAIGLELNSVAYQQCIDSGLNVHQQTIQEYAINNKDSFDVVCIFQVLEHVYEVKSFLEAAISVLKKNGKLIIGVPNNEPYIQRYDKYMNTNLPPHHVGLWNKESLQRIQTYFNIQLKEVDYDEKVTNWVADAYRRTRLWWNIKSEIHQHSLSEKVKMMMAAPLSLPLSFYAHISKGINGSQIVVLYEKK